MARVAFIKEEDHPELAEFIGRIKGRRRGLLLNLYRMLLHSPPVAEKWFEQNNVIRWETALDGRIREIAIIRIGAVNRSDYVFKSHVPKMALDEGLTVAQCDALAAGWQESPLFDARERAVLAYVDTMTKDIQVPDAVFEPLRRHFSERQIVELTVLVGTYNMHTRVLEALRVEKDIE